MTYVRLCWNIYGTNGGMWIAHPTKSREKIIDDLVAIGSYFGWNQIVNESNLLMIPNNLIPRIQKKFDNVGWYYYTEDTDECFLDESVDSFIIRCTESFDSDYEQADPEQTSPVLLKGFAAKETK